MDIKPRPKSHTQQVIEAQIGEPIEVVLERLYVDRGMTQAQVASALGTTRQSIIKWLRDFGIESRRPEPTPDLERVA